MIEPVLLRREHSGNGPATQENPTVPPIFVAGTRWSEMGHARAFENSQRAHSPLLAAGLASELKMKEFSLNLGDSPQLAAGFFN